MDIICHTLSGVAAGTLLANYSNRPWKQKSLIFLSGAFGGALPDLDAFSLWSRFDSTVGAFFNLSHSGSDIYFSKFWYSHHAALHSLFAALFIPILFVLIVCVIRRIKVKNYMITNRFNLLAFVFGFTLHLLEDMPTPAAVWGGVNLFFPSSEYVGGFGKIWWWNNYDLFLIICGVILINSLLLIPIRIFAQRARYASFCFVLGASLFLTQVYSRPIDFNYVGHTSKYNELEKQSQQIQKDILGPYIYSKMHALDQKIPLYF